MAKPSLPKGMRDYLPDEMRKRKYLLNHLTEVFERYNYQPLQTPAMENLSTLTEKYGEEGDQLLFRVLRSGDFTKKADLEKWEQKDSKALAGQIADKGLRYDLTVPLARLVAMHQHELQFPFKRYQVQPVWRADRPQKGRYREFYQFDGDVIGTRSMLHDGEMVLLFRDAFKRLDLEEVDIHINNRKILTGLAEKVGTENQFANFCATLDKVDKIGLEGVAEELQKEGMNEEYLSLVKDFIALSGRNRERLDGARKMIGDSNSGEEGIKDAEKVLSLAGASEEDKTQVLFSPSLARGLDYYTGTIYEVTHRNVEMGSIAGGGRYDDLTSYFGLKDMPGIGISFGVERIYDIMEELNCFPEKDIESTKVLGANFGEETENHTFEVVHQLREHGINADMYPDAVKLKKQFNYADKAGYTHVLVIGEEEAKAGKVQLKNLQTGEQSEVTREELLSKGVLIKE